MRLTTCRRIANKVLAVKPYELGTHANLRTWHMAHGTSTPEPLVLIIHLREVLRFHFEPSTCRAARVLSFRRSPYGLQAAGRVHAFIDLANFSNMITEVFLNKTMHPANNGSNEHHIDLIATTLYRGQRGAADSRRIVSFGDSQALNSRRFRCKAWLPRNHFIPLRAMGGSGRHYTAPNS